MGSFIFEYFARMQSTTHSVDFSKACEIVDFKDIVILVSIDGFRSQYLTQYSEYVPYLTQLAKSSAFASDGMYPIFPSYTFPNHVSLITGVYAETHGMISNEFYDCKRNDSFSYRNSSHNTDPSWWWPSCVEPIWSTIKKSQLKSAAYSWPGSEVSSHTPTYQISYPSRAEEPVERVNQVLKWISMPKNDRPSLITLYFEHVDAAGHKYGPDNSDDASDGLKSALKDVYNAIGILLKGLDQRNILSLVNLIIVSDHGMSATAKQYWVYLDLIVPLSLFSHVFYGPVAFLYPKNAQDTMMLYDLLFHFSQQYPGIFQVYLIDDLPKEYHLSNHYRIPPLTLVSYTPYYITSSNHTGIPSGTHGYPPTKDPNMNALFIAHGGKISLHSKQQYLDSFYNVDIYPFILELLTTPDIRKQGGFRLNYRHNGSDTLIKRLLLD